jgi:hypothetical protein
MSPMLRPLIPTNLFIFLQNLISFATFDYLNPSLILPETWFDYSNYEPYDAYFNNVGYDNL